MRNYDEYIRRIRAKAKNIKTRRRVTAASCSAVLVLVLVLTLFIPYNSQLLDVDRYRDSPYYKLIPGLNKVAYQPPQHKNNYEWLKSALSGIRSNATGGAAVALPETSGDELISFGGSSDLTFTNDAMDQENQTYQEGTDNQVQGVIEGDLFKRSDKYIYYLRGTVLSVYTIGKENSREIVRREIFPEDREQPGVTYRGNTHLYLSADCTTLTVVGQGYDSDIGSFTVVTSLDVTDPTSIQVNQPVYFAGSIISSRMVDGQLLLIYNYRVDGQIDFDKPETFVPRYGSYGNVMPIDADNIYCPVEEPNAARYTVVAMLDSKTLAVKDTAALLSYSGPVYVSETAIYATYGCAREETADENTLQTACTEITGISYTGEELDILGTVTLEGSVQDQYFMDEFDGVLRVATTSCVLTLQNANDGAWRIIKNRKYNCNLYCIDLSTWSVASSVIAFAPDGEEVTSARFDGPMGYVCTAEVIIMTDPVYFFDLSDIQNITYKHTPVIDGYSSSLINFGDYLLGIGINDRREMKVEIYEETADGVMPVTAFELPATASGEYKSYYIDRENNLLGIPVRIWNDDFHYLLLHFDGYELRSLKDISITGELSNIRADIIDGYLYLLEGNLQVVRIF